MKVYAVRDDRDYVLISRNPDVVILQQLSPDSDYWVAGPDVDYHEKVAITLRSFHYLTGMNLLRYEYAILDLMHMSPPVVWHQIQ